MSKWPSKILLDPLLSFASRDGYYDYHCQYIILLLQHDFVKANLKLKVIKIGLKYLSKWPSKILLDSLMNLWLCVHVHIVFVFFLYFIFYYYKLTASFFQYSIILLTPTPTLVYPHPNLSLCVHVHIAFLFFNIIFFY